MPEGPHSTGLGSEASEARSTKTLSAQRGPWSRFRSMDSLTVRLAVGITVLVVSLLAAGLYTSSRLHFKRMIGARQRSAEMQNRVLAATLRHQMIHEDRSLIRTILREIGSEPDIQSAMILDHEGTVRYSSRLDRVGDEIPQESPTCMVCHSQAEDSRERWTLIETETGTVLRSVVPFDNRPRCHQCHNPAQRINGILILDMSVDEVNTQLQRDAVWMGCGTLVLAVLLFAGVTLLVRHLILIRLAKLSRTARSIAAGNLTERIALQGHDRIASLAQDFNAMADTASQLITEVGERESQLASVMNSLDDGLVVLDRDFRVIGANRSFSKRLRTHPEALRQHTCREAVGGTLPCCPCGDECPAGRCLATGEVQRAVFREEGDAGRVEEVYASPVLDENGEVTQVVEIWRDITTRVKEEEQLAEVERLVSLGVLASGFSHEVSTPLASMLTCAESVLGQIDEPGEGADREGTIAAIRGAAETIRQEVLRCRKITEQFRRFARGIPPSVEVIDLREVVAGVVALASPTAREAGVGIQIDGGESVPAVTANTEVVQHVVLNLLVNAIQSIGDAGGSIRVGFRSDSKVRIQIRDTGRGIAPEDRRHLFEPFRSRKPQGTGLGLFLSRNFMRRFGGDVRLVESKLRVGSCFEIVFPPADKQ